MPATESNTGVVDRFLGRRLNCTYEIDRTGRAPPHDHRRGPFSMETTHTRQDAPSGQSRMGFRDRGEPSGFSKIVVRWWRLRCAGRAIRTSIDSRSSSGPLST